MSGKHKVATDALETLGTIIDDSAKRDAIHLAVIPAVAGEDLLPGMHVQLADGVARFYNLKNLRYQSAPDIRSISKSEYNTLTEQQRKYFYWSQLDYGYHKRADSYHLDVPIHYLIVKVEKRIITHVRDIDPELLSREAELKAFLEPYWRGFYNDKYYSRFENRSERRAINVELSEVRKTKDYERN
jgi:hypothetical protein